MDFYDYIDACREQGLTGSEALNAWQRDYAEYQAELIEEIEERQSHFEYQQDLIDMYRFER